MKIIKFIKFWWAYNIKRINNGDDASTLFYIASILLIPFIFGYFWIFVTKDIVKESRDERKQFWDKWKNIN